MTSPSSSIDNGSPASILAWLGSEQGEHLLRIADTYPADRLTRITRLRKLCDPKVATAATELLELRKRGHAKFQDASRMLFTARGLEQSTGERIAHWRASRFPRGDAILDACCGIGGDAIALAQNGSVVAVDLDPATATCAAHNSGLAGGDVRVLCCDVTRLDLRRAARKGVIAAFFDPSRRVANPGNAVGRVTRGDLYEPPLEFARDLAQDVGFVGVKVSPAIDDVSLSPFLQYHGCTIEFVSLDRECKEAVIWLPHGAEASACAPPLDNALRATVITQGTSHTLSPNENAHSVSAPVSEYLYEPDAAVVRAHLTESLAMHIGAARVSHDSHYLTSHQQIDTPFAVRYRALECMPLHVDKVRKRCAELGLTPTTVKARWEGSDPITWLRKIGNGSGTPSAGTEGAVVALYRDGERRSAVICLPDTN